jgi:hypothetical protein
MKEKSILSIKNTNSENLDYLLDNYSDFKEDIYQMWERGINFYTYEIEELFKYLRRLKKQSRDGDGPKNSIRNYYTQITFDKFPYKTQPRGRHPGGYIRCIINIREKCYEKDPWLVPKTEYDWFKQGLFFYNVTNRWRKV